MLLQAAKEAPKKKKEVTCKEFVDNRGRCVVSCYFLSVAVRPMPQHLQRSGNQRCLAVVAYYMTISCCT